MMTEADFDPIRILAVDDDPNVCWTIKERFGAPKYEVEIAGDCEAAIDLAQQMQPHIILLDIKIPGGGGLDILPRLKTMNPEVAIIVLSGFSDPKNVVEALQLGAEDFIAKPFDPAIVEIAMKNIREKRNLRDQVSRLKNELERDHAFGMLVGESTLMVDVREFVEQVASTDLNVLIRGESGTGKDVTARLIHHFSRNHEGPFVKVNCAALPENLIESELFGYEKGAFTGAVRPKPGRFQLAHGGTIFLDEITEIPFPLQSKLLQVLEQREFVRVGGTRTIKVDCRCIAATNANMEQALEHRSFREDLYFRLNEFSVHLPPLRDRAEDIPLLIDYFLSLYSERYQRPRKDLSPTTVRMMMDYPWPGNVRELESLLKRMLVLDSEDIIHQTIGVSSRQNAEQAYMPSDRSRGSEMRFGVERSVPYGLPGYQRTPAGRTAVGSPTHASAATPFSAGQPHSPVRVSAPQVEPPTEEVEEVSPFAAPAPSPAEPDTLKGDEDLDLKAIVDRAIERAEREAITASLNRTKWNRRKSAQQLGISYSSLLRRIAKYNLESE